MGGHSQVGREDEDAVIQATELLLDESGQYTTLDQIALFMREGLKGYVGHSTTRTPEGVCIAVTVQLPHPVRYISTRLSLEHTEE